MILAYHHIAPVEAVPPRVERNEGWHFRHHPAALERQLLMLRGRGYSFISPDQALADEAYRLPEEYVGRGGFSWIHRWSRTKGMAPKREPDPPRWVQDAWARTR